MVVSPEILEEYYRVGEILSKSYPDVDMTPVLEFITINAGIVSPSTLEEPICVDPDDDKFFTCAIAGRCDIIVSGDKHLLNKSGFAGVSVQRPRDFVDKVLIRI
jgi:predicted nucleic acid-binding protein